MSLPRKFITNHFYIDGLTHVVPHATNKILIDPWLKLAHPGSHISMQNLRIVNRIQPISGLWSQLIDSEAVKADDASESLTIKLFWHRLLAADRRQSQGHRHRHRQTAPLDCQAFDRPWWHPAAEELLVQLRQRPAEPPGLGTSHRFGNSSCIGPKSIEIALDIKVEMGKQKVENGRR